MTSLQSYPYNLVAEACLPAPANFLRSVSVPGSIGSRARCISIGAHVCISASSVAVTTRIGVCRVGVGWRSDHCDIGVGNCDVSVCWTTSIGVSVVRVFRRASNA